MTEIERLERRIIQLVEAIGELKDSLKYSEEKWRRERDKNIMLQRAIDLLEGEKANVADRQN